jgi:hypothetical protein
LAVPHLNSRPLKNYDGERIKLKKRLTRKTNG